MSNPYNIQNISGDKIGVPIPVFSNDLDEGYIWLEGAEVSKTVYNKLYEVYGDDYGTPQNPDNFVLPDCRDRTFWGSPDGRFGYLEATAPNITGNSYASFITAYDDAPGSQGAIVETSYVRNTPCSNSRYGGYITWMFNAHNSNPTYQDGATLRPPSIKCRVKTRYK